ncbi:potassium channel family protein [Sphingomonas sp. R86520]|uniref:potassium channel family protein n=1 Tax=Sphingomonas sp. R86520 TaxID=3093859 RepID=UPI0036D257F3
MSVLVQLGIASVMVFATVLIHFIGLSALLVVVRRYHGHANHRRKAIGDAIAILGAAIGLSALHSAEIWLYAALYWQRDVFTSFEQGLYFSTSTYATIGYGDVVLPLQSRLIGAIEGANGILLFGWSTAFLFSVVDRMKLLERELDAPVHHQQDEAHDK